MTSSRRHFLRQATLAAASAVAPVHLARAACPLPTVWIRTPHGTHNEPDLAALAQQAVDAARSAGAAYADVRLGVTRSQEPGFSESEERGFGVRVLYNGYWGFLSSAVWTPDEAARLAREAVAQAKAHSRGKARPVELGPVPTVQRGEWVMPVKYDPFDIPVPEKLDIMRAFSDAASRYRVGISTNTAMSFLRQQNVFASSDGASWAQTRYESSASFGVAYRAEFHAGLGRGGWGADGLSLAGRGWELVADSGLMDQIPKLVDEAERTRHRTPFDVGRYDVVCSAEAMATLLDQTLGPATELDRALGYEANAGGTSYLGDPLAMLGTQVVASPLVTVTANRSLPGAVATAKWDDEGVVPDEFTIVHDGILVDYQTTREQAAWLAPYYHRVGRPVRSHGCANASSALVIPMQHAPNLALMPGATSATFDDLVADTENGIALLGLALSMDQQVLNGMGRRAVLREIKHGKLGRYLSGDTGILFRAPELWKSVVAIGGAGSQEWFGMYRGKGQPGQSTGHSVGAVPAKIKQLSIIDPRRKA